MDLTQFLTGHPLVVGGFLQQGLYRSEGMLCLPTVCTGIHLEKDKIKQWESKWLFVSYKGNSIVKLERDYSLIISLSISLHTTVYTTGISIWNICEQEPTTNMAYMGQTRRNQEVNYLKWLAVKKFKHQRVCTTSQNFNILGGKQANIYSDSDESKIISQFPEYGLFQ